MNTTPDLLTRFSSLEERLLEAESALTDSSPRVVALGKRGPLITPDLPDWKAYDHDLENDLMDCLARLSDLLQDISWKGPQIPEKVEQWDGWLDKIRIELTKSLDRPINLLTFTKVG